MFPLRKWSEVTGFWQKLSRKLSAPKGAIHQVVLRSLVASKGGQKQGAAKCLWCQKIPPGEEQKIEDKMKSSSSLCRLRSLACLNATHFLRSLARAPFTSSFLSLKVERKHYGKTMTLRPLSGKKIQEGWSLGVHIQIG